MRQANNMSVTDEKDGARQSAPHSTGKTPIGPVGDAQRTSLASSAQPSIFGRVMGFILRPALRPQATFQTAQMDRVQQHAAAAHDAALKRVEWLEAAVTQLASDAKQEIVAIREEVSEAPSHGSLIELEARLSDTTQAAFDATVAGVVRIENLEAQLSDTTQAAFDATAAGVVRIENLEAQLSDATEAGVVRIENLEAHLPEMLADINTDLNDIRATHSAQGREIDEVGGELVSVTQQLRKFRKLVDRYDEQQSLFSRRIRSLEKRFEPLTDLDHFDFANAYRGDEATIRARLETYAKQFGQVKQVFDFGCGRGEFLKTCSDLGIGAYGFDTDADMVSHCELQNLDAYQGDALAHLRELPSRSLDGIFSAQVVEHLTPVEIVELIQIASEKLKRGGKIILETINPSTWSAMRWFYLDPSHCQPVPAEMLRFFLEDAHFEVLDTIYSSPVPDDEKLTFPENDSDFQDPAVTELAQITRRNWERLNHTVFGPQDYAIIAER
jgi:2-polyprenyl-3-methyl-5-hydroxy-6-metoxy-1,4-benzoquinol methylase